MNKLVFLFVTGCGAFDTPPSPLPSVHRNERSNDANSEYSLLLGLSQLEQLYIDDCQDDLTPHGYYGAFFQPCEYAFYDGVCSADSSRQIGNPKPNLHWLFQLQDHVNKNDWDDLNSNEIPRIEDLVLWPDQCVGVVPRCYSFAEENSSKVMDTLRTLFPEGLPDAATHVQVDCRSDALELSRAVFSFTTGVEDGIRYVVGMVSVILLLHIVAISFCCFGCFRWCFRRQVSELKAVPAYQAVPAGNGEVGMGTVTTGLDQEEGAVELSQK
ncbi:MAG: hypothetical protein SGILL_002097, partial [Bacillariaceae sp.]